MGSGGRLIAPTKVVLATVQVFKGDPVAALGNERPLLFITSLKVNTDGTKISYHKDDLTGRRCVANPAATPCAINNIRNAYNNPDRPESDFAAVRDASFPLPKTWRVLSETIIEKNASTGKPCITSDGYLVSMTADRAIDDGREGIASSRNGSTLYRCLPRCDKQSARWAAKT